MICYYKLFDMLNRSGIRKTDLLNVISSGSLAKLGKNENVYITTIFRLCLYLNCQPGDIMEYIPDAEDVGIRERT